MPAHRVYPEFNRRGFAHIILIITLIILVSAGAFVYWKIKIVSRHPLNDIVVNSLPTVSSSQATISPSPQNFEMKIQGKVIGWDVKSGEAFANFNVETSSGVYAVSVPTREIAGVVCDQDSPWPNENDPVIAFGRITGDKKISCISNGHYFKRDETANWKTYTNSKFKYSFSYPPPMTLSEDINNNTVLLKTQSGDGVNISVSDLRTIPSLRQDINTLLSSPIGYEVKEGKTIIRTVKKLDQFNLGGEQAVKVFGTEKDDVATVYSTAVYLIKNDFGYIINTEPTRDLSKEKELTKTLDQIISTFKFLN